MVNAEQQRLDEADTHGVPWRRWGPYLSERQWGTVREDYGGGHDTWSSFTHEQARSRAYRWGEDGLAGISDDRQLLCLSVALWNERDPILKERMFGLTNAEGNHGEDVKECYFYLDATPTSSYLRMLYKYPQAEFPYAELVAVNGARGKSDPEYELLDTGIFDEGRYFDVDVEVARDISDRLTGTFLRDSAGRRPVHAGQSILQNDPHWRDLVLFYEYFHGDNGAGIGASHQTGWTGTVALLPLLFRSVNAEALRNMGGIATAGGAPRQKTAARRTAASRRAGTPR